MTAVTDRPLTTEELTTARMQLVPPPGGWSDYDGSAGERAQARREKRWHAYRTNGGIFMQDIVTGRVEEKKRANRKERRAYLARARRGG